MPRTLFPAPSLGLPGFDPARTRGPAPHGCRPSRLPLLGRSAYCGSEAQASAESFQPTWFLRALLRSRRAHRSSSPGLFCPPAPRAPAQLTGGRCCPPMWRSLSCCSCRCRSRACAGAGTRLSLGGDSAASWLPAGPSRTPKWQPQPPRPSGLPQPVLAARTTQSLFAAGGPRGRIQPSPLFLSPAADVIEETTGAAERPDEVSQS